jgi:hypothetical protein
MKLLAVLLVAMFTLTGCKSDGTASDTDTISTFDNFSDGGQARCTKKGGLWADDDGLARCVYDTGEGTKSCTSGRDCKGECLAASKTCSPFEPLIGCTEVISDGGLLQKLCS